MNEVCNKTQFTVIAKFRG